MSDDSVLAALMRLEAKMEVRFERIDARLATTDGRLERLEDVQARLRVDLMERMDRLGNRQTAFRTEVMRGFERIEDRLTSVREDVGVNFSRADRAIDAANKNEQELRDMRRAMQRMQIRLDNLEDKT